MLAYLAVHYHGSAWSVTNYTHLDFSTKFLRKIFPDAQNITVS